MLALSWRWAVKLSNIFEKRKSNTQRLEREYELAVKKQEKLALKMGKVCPESGTAHASAGKEGEEKPPFSAA